eukprot:901312-Rhodomonas_salina.1
MAKLDGCLCSGMNATRRLMLECCSSAVLGVARSCGTGQQHKKGIADAAKEVGADKRFSSAMTSVAHAPSTFCHTICISISHKPEP